MHKTNIWLIVWILLLATATFSNTYTVINTNDSGDGSLRKAITDANANAGPDKIEFNIPGAGPTWTLQPTSELSLTDDGTHIDGTTQAGYGEWAPVIEVDGTNAPAGGFSIQAANCTIEGLVINKFSTEFNDGVKISGESATRNHIVANFIGTNVAGTADLGNGSAGARIRGGAKFNVVERNVISGNNQWGVAIHDTNTNSNEVKGNYIGTDVTGSVDLGNGEEGVHIEAGASYNIVGGAVPEARNIISGNDNVGVNISETNTNSNEIKGNYIGINAAGTGALGNGNGIVVNGGARFNIIGGSTAGERNTISGNVWNGVAIPNNGTNSNEVKGNYIGTDASGAAALGNGLVGVAIASGAQFNRVGGSTAGARNIISGGNLVGVVITDEGTSRNEIKGNYIGTDVTGTVDLGNDEDGVAIGGGAQFNIVGGASAAERNIICGNNTGGVAIIYSNTNSNEVKGNYIGRDANGAALGNGTWGIGIYNGARFNLIGGATTAEGNVITSHEAVGIYISGEATDYNTISHNSISQNRHLGIDLDPERMTANDSGDLDTGPNENLNFPEDISATYVGGTTTISGTAVPEGAVEIFLADLHPDGVAEGKTFLASAVADSSGSWSAALTSLSVGDAITTTATDTLGNTSEFSPGVAVAVPTTTTTTTTTTSTTTTSTVATTTTTTSMGATTTTSLGFTTTTTTGTSTSTSTTTITTTTTLPVGEKISEPEVEIVPSTPAPTQPAAVLTLKFVAEESGMADFVLLTTEVPPKAIFHTKINVSEGQNVVSTALSYYGRGDLKKGVYTYKLVYKGKVKSGAIYYQPR